MSRPKLQDVAAHAGVSVATVSRVLNNRGYLSESIRQRVGDAVSALGYRPNEIARSLIGQRSRLVGVIVPTVADSFFGELVSRIEGALAAQGYKMLLCDSLENAEREAEYLEMLQANRVDGIITSTHNRGVDGYDRADLPIVALDRQINDRIPNVRSDNKTGGRLATGHLIARGSRSAVHITATDHAANARAAAYRETMTRHGLEPRVVAYGYSTPMRERRALIETWLMQNDADGVFASDDLTALMVLEWARKTGRAVPESLRIVGYDGSRAVQLAVPGLTTVRQPIGRLSARAVEALIERIEAPDEGVDRAPESPLPVELHQGWTS